MAFGPHDGVVEGADGFRIQHGARGIARLNNHGRSLQVGLHVGGYFADYRGERALDVLRALKFVGIDPPWQFLDVRNRATPGLKRFGA